MIRERTTSNDNGTIRITTYEPETLWDSVRLWWRFWRCPCGCGQSRYSIWRINRYYDRSMEDE